MTSSQCLDSSVGRTRQRYRRGHGCESLSSLSCFQALISQLLKDVRAKIFQSIDFLKFLPQSDNELLVSEMQKKKLGVTDFVSEMKRMENYPDFEKLAHVVQHGLLGFIVKNIEGESTQANDHIHIL